MRKELFPALSDYRFDFVDGEREIFREIARCAADGQYILFNELVMCIMLGADVSLIFHIVVSRQDIGISVSQYCLKLPQRPDVEGAFALFLVGRSVEGVGIFGREETTGTRSYGRCREICGYIVDGREVRWIAGEEVSIKIDWQQLCLIVEPMTGQSGKMENQALRADSHLLKVRETPISRH